MKPPSPAATAHGHILAYYTHCDIDYRWFWNLQESQAMHFGYWDETTRNLADSLGRLNAVMARHARLSRHDHVLDAGCGVGGSSIWLAQHLGCSVTGISLVPDQIRRAEENASRCGVGATTNFLVGDYHRTVFDHDAFDVVWAIESVCHTEDKPAFLREAFRLLKPGGRIIVSDFFATNNRRTSDDESLLKQWLHGWAMHAPLASADEFRDSLWRAGFGNVTYTDITPHMVPSSRRLFLLSLPGVVVGLVAEWLGLRNRVQTGNFRSSRYQYQAFKRGLWQYGMCYAEKPPSSHRKENR